MVRRGVWGLWVAAWLGSGCSAQDTLTEREQGTLSAPSGAPELGGQGSPAVPEGTVRFARATAPEASPAERARQGDPSWRSGRPAKRGELEVHTSTDTALTGERICVQVSAPADTVVRAEVYRLGFYGGAGARKVWSGGPDGGPTRGGGGKTFSFEVGEDWAPGLYLVKVSRPDGTRRFVSMVVKSRRATEPPA